MVAHAIPRRFAHFVEAVFGTGPADWSANGTNMYAIDIDVSSVAQAVEANENNRFSLHDRHANIRTLKQTEFSFATYMHGSTTNAAEAAAATAYHLSVMLKSALGGQDLGYGIGFSGGSAAAPEIDSDPGYQIGDWIWAYDDSAATGQFYKITNIVALVLTLDRDLHFTPAVADRAYSVINCFIDDAVTTNHSHADHTTMSFYAQGEEAEDTFAMYGCKPSVGFEAIESGMPSKLSWSVLASKFAVDTITADTFTSVTTFGSPGTVPGVTDSTYVKYATVASPMASIGNAVGGIQITPGVEYERVTGANGAVEGVHGHVDSDAGPAAIELTIVPFDDAHNAAFRAGTKRHLLVGVGATPSAYPWGVYFPNLEYASEPTRADEGAVTGSALSFRALMGPASGSLTGADERRFRSPMQVLLVA